VVVQKFLNIQLEYLGAIPQDNNVSKAVMQQKPFSLIYPTSPSAKAIFDLANNLNNDEIPVKNQHNRGIASLFSNLLRTKSMK
jgi:flagellar biosynthesis protein FlhG